MGSYLELWWGEILPGVFFLCVTVAVWGTVGLLASKLSSGGLPVKPVKLEELREHSFELMGALLGFSVMGHNLAWAGVSAVVGAGVGYLGKTGYRWFLLRLAEEKRAGEVLLLYEIISVYAAAGYSLYEALSAGAYLASGIEKPLRRCLQSWGYGPQRALRRLGEELNVPEGHTLSNILQIAATLGLEKITDFLRQEGVTMESIRRYRVERRLQSRVIVQTMYLLLPGLALLGVTMFPVGYHIANMIRSIKLQ